MNKSFSLQLKGPINIKLKIQKKSFQAFLEKGIKEEANKLNDINFNKFKIKLDTNNIKYKELKYATNKCIIKNKTYTLNIYIPAKLFFKKKIILKCALNPQNFKIHFYQ